MVPTEVSAHFTNYQKLEIMTPPLVEDSSFERMKVAFESSVLLAGRPLPDTNDRMRPNKSRKNTHTLSPIGRELDGGVRRPWTQGSGGSFSLGERETDREWICP